MASTYIIAEAGVNHNGSMEMAKQLIEEAAKAGADAVKFQTFKADEIISKAAPKAEYQKNTTGTTESQFEMVRKLELDELMHNEIADHCRKNNIQFLSTPFDVSSVDLLVKMQVPLLKIPSGEITNAPLILKVTKTGLPVILSTGMSNLGDIEAALGVLAFGYLNFENPSIKNFRNAYNSVEGQKVLLEKVSLLHCTTEYPAPIYEVNLKCMQTMRNAFGLPVGYSDHTMGITVPVAAVALGATIIEKHFTLDRNLPGPDHKASLEPKELQEMVKAIREVEAALGSELKLVTSSEEKNIDIARKSIVASKAIKEGEIFSVENITCKRPGNGISAMHYFDLIGKTATKDFDIEEQLG